MANGSPCWLDKTMPDFFCTIVIDGQAILSPEDSHHARRVLRLRSGEAIRVHINGTSYAASYHPGKEQDSAVLGETLPGNDSALKLTLYQGLPKGDKLEQIVRQATELGVCRIVPCLMARSVSKPGDFNHRLLRLQKIAREAAMQSGRDTIPEVEAPISMEELATRLTLHQLALLPYEKSNNNTLLKAYDKQTDVALVIGPEGGFEEIEVEQLPAVPVTLGRRILRTETAGIAAAAVLFALADENLEEGNTVD